MVKTRQAKVDLIADYIPAQKICQGEDAGDILILGWGSTYGVITSCGQKMIAQGHKISHCHLRNIRPFAKNLSEIVHNFKTVIVPEINNGQLVKIIRSEFLVDAIPYNKIKGTPITQEELEAFIVRHMDEKI